jgi:Putative redox-active protein (C_GCAxxG_C_C).
MGKLFERCKQLREDTTVHYGCSQAVFIPVAEALGMDIDTAMKVSQHFRAGMFTGSTCGAVTGAIMALGLANAPAKASVELQKRMLSAHADCIHCESLLSRHYAAGNKEKKPHCDAMCYEAVSILEELLPELA